MNPDVCIVSGTTCLQLPGPINHKIYAELHRTDYRFEFGPYASMDNPMRYFKLKTLLRILPRYDWVLWVDDDAFFTDFSRDVRSLIYSAAPDIILMLADGKVRPVGQWTFINAGVLLIKNCADSLTFLQNCFDVDDGLVRNWWDPEKHGMFTNSDQDAIIYHLFEKLAATRFTVVPHSGLNARPYHYQQRLDEHFICHFPGVPDRINAIRKFGERFGVGQTLVPSSILDSEGFRERAGEQFIALPRRKFWDRVQRRVKRTLSNLTPR